MLGMPIGHSLSPVLHRAAYRALGLDGWSYDAIECDEGRLPALLAQCGPGWAGLSLTMPLKRTVLPLLDRTEPLAAEVGAVNTVVFHAGQRHGHNTDVPGMVTALSEAGLTEAISPGAGLAGQTPEVLVLGAGATACSALAALRQLGVGTVTVAARDPARATTLLEVAQRLGVRVELSSFGLTGPAEASPAEASPAEVGGATARRAPGLLVSTVPAGAADTYAALVSQGALVPRGVLDVVYHPWPTPLVTAARGAGVAVAGGFELLLHQAVYQVELMTGQHAPVAPMREAGLAALAGRAVTGAGNSEPT